MNNLDVPVFCGRGSVKCKVGYECTIDPADRFGVCCPLGELLLTKPRQRRKIRSEIQAICTSSFPEYVDNVICVAFC